jgi:hypothetical protein
MSISAQTLVGRRAPLDHDGENDFHIGTRNGRPPAQPADASSSPRHALAGIHEYTAQTLVNGRGQLDRDGEYLFGDRSVEQLGLAQRGLRTRRRAPRSFR